MPMAIPLLAAAGTAAAGIAAGGIIGGVMVAGAAMTAVGAITGSQKLQKWGGIVSLAGGVAGLATGAWSATASTVANDAASAGFGGAEYGMAEAAANSGGGMAGIGGSAADAMSQANAGAAASSPGAIQPTPAAAPTTAPAAGGWQQGQQLTYGQAPPAQSNGLLGSVSDKIKAGFDWATDKANPNNARIVQAGAGLIGSLGQGYAQQEAAKEQIRAQEDARARARQRLNDSMTGLKMPVYKGA